MACAGIANLTVAGAGGRGGQISRHDSPAYIRHRFPAEIISHAVWLYHVFSISLRDVELILAERGIMATHESIRHWCCLKFGGDFAGRLRRRRWSGDQVWARQAQCACQHEVLIWSRPANSHTGPRHLGPHQRPDKCQHPDLAPTRFLLTQRGRPQMSLGNFRPY
jgi:putative transposase